METSKAVDVRVLFDWPAAPSSFIGRADHRFRWLLVVTLLSLSGLPSGFADIDIQVNDGLLTLRVRGASLVDVLDRLSHQTGLKVVYEGQRPSQLITADIAERSESEALSRLFEGLDVNYALRTDETGRRVELLIISGRADSRTSGTSSQEPGARAAMKQDSESSEAEEPPSLEESPVDVPESADTGQTPWLETDGPPSGPVSPNAEPAMPAFPSPASYPEPLPFFPPYASYPPRAQPPFN
jgi:hypothetical protein